MIPDQKANTRKRTIVLFLAVLIGAALVMGYTIGKDMALRDNRSDAAAKSTTDR